ncbi:MAG: DUF305 domain-containing protein [Actinomycetota bacterium]|nr:DUF305 domain-containing protein [Actinomycetota bacterium]
MNRALRTLALPAALATALALTACGSPSDTTTSNPGGMPSMGASSPTTGSPPSAGAPAEGPHNAADVSFATDMIPHHSQAVTMATMATTAATNADVKTLAAAISAAQAPEIKTMSGWLAGWGAPVPDTAAGGHDMAGMGGGSMDGMMSDQQMTDLGATTGKAFDRMWLELMISHHQGAVAMSTTELSAGQNPAAKTLAQSIIDGQSAEITTMKRLLAAEPTS